MKTEYRYKAARGLEYKTVGLRDHWHQVTPQMLAAMTSDELREVADAMDAASNKEQ